ncbi:MAG: universal stress protein [Saprospiraceae bacterium]|nr:universal stress protein [Saprospiraceae bacterium]
MKNIQKILFPTDFSEAAQNALRYAIHLADELDASIHLLHIVYPQAEPLDFPALATEATQQQVGAAEMILKRTVEETLAQIQVTGKLKNSPVILPDVEIGTPTNLITRIAEREEVDLIVMGAKGEHSMIEKAFGRVSLGVVKNANTPVLLIPENATFTPIKNVAYASNLLETDVYYIWQTLQMMEPFDAALRVIHVETEDIGKPTALDDFQALFAEHPKYKKLSFHELNGEEVDVVLSGFMEAWEINIMALYAPNYGFFESIFHRSLGKKLLKITEVPLLFLKKK